MTHHADWNLHWYPFKTLRYHHQIATRAFPLRRQSHLRAINRHVGRRRSTRKDRRPRVQVLDDRRVAQRAKGALVRMRKLGALAFGLLPLAVVGAALGIEMRAESGLAKRAWAENQQSETMCQWTRGQSELVHTSIHDNRSGNV